MTPENGPVTPPENGGDSPRSEQIPPIPRGWQTTIPGLGRRAAGPDEIGPVQAGVEQQIQAMHSDKLLTPMHAGLVALAVRAARDVDQSEGIGAPSGRAKLLEVLNGILERFPEVETVSEGVIDDVLAAIMAEDDEAEVAGP